VRLGGPILSKYDSPESWVAAVQAYGYRATGCPVKFEADEAEIEAYAQAARAADIVIAEVGAWSNPLSPDETIRRAALETCKRGLALADKIGARCCVNIAGSRGETWAGPHESNLGEETFEMIVEITRQIIDAVEPKRTFFTLEPMPWIFPDSPDNYLRLIAAINRRAFAVHLDPVNMINSPHRYFHNAAFIRECFQKLGPYIKSCHAKDTLLAQKLTTHLDEVRPGLGRLDYTVFLTELNKLDPNLPLLLEHLPDEAEYRLAADYVRAVARQVGVSL
jgi:sugar phosphate isomerase/epimerase